MAKSKRIDYRKIYAQYYGIEVPEDVDIHHIDFDRSNNDPSNLLMLPKDLHQRYHYILTAFNCYTNNKKGTINLGLNDIDSTKVKILKHLYPTMKECCKWKEYRDQRALWREQNEIHNRGI